MGMVTEGLTGEEFRQWLELMIAKKLAANKLGCAQLLGRSDQWVSDSQKKGVDRLTALACAALLAGLSPFTSASVKSSRQKSTHQDHA